MIKRFISGLLLVATAALFGCGGGGGGGGDGTTSTTTSTSTTTTTTASTTTTTLPSNLATPITIAGGTQGYTDGTGTAAQFKYANSVTTDGTDLYVANGRTMRKVTTAGVVTTIAGSGDVSGSADGTGSAALFQSITGVVAYDGNLYVTDGLGNTVRKIVISTGVVTTIAGSAGVSGSDDGVGIAARFNQPMGITTDGTSLYIADYGNGSIRKMDISSGTVTTVATIQFPKGITTAIGGGSLYVTDGINVVIYKIISGTLTQWDTSVIAGGVSGSADGVGTAASFKSPYGIVEDGGYLYVADTTNYAVRKINIATNEVTTISVLDSGVGPTGITKIGNIIYTSNTDNTIKKIQ
ncbi:MAG: hypothetical protein PHY09_15720 [Desulfuromonadaceae bacterium]|nr:hypothetical protein [Desulfuromonadaceae bacterium]MDD5104564.1 hypothetical protein [Desulfuromonadaceae bacterium]